MGLLVGHSVQLGLGGVGHSVQLGLGGVAGGPLSAVPEQLKWCDLSDFE